MISGLIARIRSLWTGMRKNDLDAEMRAEFEHHMALRARDLVTSGISPEDATRQARVEFGGTYNYKEAGRDARGLRWFDAFRVSWLDIKLGGRMLRRYPALAVIGSAAIGVAIAVGAGTLGVLTMLRDPSIPLSEGERIVGIQVWDTRTMGVDRKLLHDFVRWRAEMRTVREFAAFRQMTRNLGITDEGLELTVAAAMTASGFRIARVNPLLGRYLVDDDERLDAPAVAVLGHDLWVRRFGADSSIVGKSVLFGQKAHTIVGVMPAGFAFPVNYSLWIPLRADPSSFRPREGPQLIVFGRLAPGATLEAAQAEVAAIGLTRPDTNTEAFARLRPTVAPFAQSWMELDGPDMQLVIGSFQVGAVLLLIVICVNVAILVYARTATRQGEIAVRTALGASRARVVAQLVGEALVLAAVGAAFGLVILSVVSAQLQHPVLQSEIGPLPFWFSTSIPDATLLYVVALAVLAAVIIGAIPALQLTGRRVQASLQRLVTSTSSIRMGKLWTALIVAEVAFTVAIMPAATFVALLALKAAVTGPGFEANQYLSAIVAMDRDVSDVPVTPEAERAFARQFAAHRDEMIRRLGELSEVDAVTFSRAIPGDEGGSRIEIDSVSGTDTTRRVSSARLGRVAPGWFEVYGVPLIAGRTFGPSDADSTARAVVVNRSFVDTVFQGRSAIGRRIRQMWTENGAEQRGPWLNIVGVVSDFPAYVGGESRVAWYQAAGSEPIPAVALAIRTRGADPRAFSGTLRTIAAAVNPSLQLRDIQPLDDGIRSTHLPTMITGAGLSILTLSVLLLSAAAVSALMSVTVTQRRREIAIRIALGAERNRLLLSIFARAAAQVGSGIGIGLILAGSFNRLTSGEMLGGKGLVILPSIALFMIAVGTLSALGPARRGLSIQPSAVLKGD
jgi:putative ABC transport system permease protein